MAVLWIAGIFFFTTTLNTSFALQCSLSTHPQTRIFKNMDEYQHNNITFNPSFDECIGNIVEIKELKSTLTHDYLKTYESNYIVRLLLNKKLIYRIETDAFTELHCLESLDLQQNFVSELIPGSLNHLEHLRHLNLSGNNITILREGVISNHSQLKTLDLSKNRIQTIERAAFDNLSYLRVLNLSGNAIAQIDVRGNLLNLGILNLSHNQLSNLSFQENFIFAQLTRLLLDNNKLNTFPVEMLLNKRIPHLALATLDGNPWNCKNIFFVVTHFNHIEFDRVYEDCNENTTVTTESPATSTTDITESTVIPKVNCENNRNESNSEILNAISSMNTTITTLIVFICLYLCAQMAINCGLIEKIRNYNDNNTILDDRNVENIRLMSSTNRLDANA